MTFHSRQLPAARSCLQLEQVTEVLVRVLGSGCMWHFRRAGTCRSELQLSVALGLPGSEVWWGQLAAVRFGCPHLWEGAGVSLSSSCPFLPIALSQPEGRGAWDRQLGQVA